MCRKEFLVLPFLFLLLHVAAGALRPEEPGPWYLISEGELRSLEQYRERSEQEKRNWLLQVQLLNREADLLHRESASLNGQLSQARDRNRRLEKSFGEFEAGASLTISQKDMRISALETENEKQAGKIRVFLAAAIAAGAAAFLFICLKFFRSTKALGGLWK